MDQVTKMIHLAPCDGEVVVDKNRVMETGLTVLDGKLSPFLIYGLICRRCAWTSFNSENLRIERLDAASAGKGA